MESNAKIEFLQGLIEKTLISLIASDYWLLNVPYHGNVGDGLIWQGELDFLKKFSFKCKGSTSYESPIPSSIKKEDLIPDSSTAFNDIA